MISTLREALAQSEKDRWTRWMRHCLGRMQQNIYGDYVLAAADYDKWKRQCETHYLDLTEKEKEHDRFEADRTLLIMSYFHPLEKATVNV